jgi:hypothetical protein
MKTTLKIAVPFSCAAAVVVIGAAGCATDVSSRSRTIENDLSTRADSLAWGGPSPAMSERHNDAPPPPLTNDPRKSTQAADSPPLGDLMTKVANISTDGPLTPREFRSPPGARIVWVEF